MDDFSAALNHILVEVYYNILRVEEVSLKNKSKINLSINEMHLIEKVGDAGGTGIPISALADQLNITRPSATIAVNKLTRKGYLEKVDCKHDGRVVRACLTKEGERINVLHRYYHRNMVQEIDNTFSPEEKNCLLRAIDKLNEYFKKSIGA